MKCVWYYDTELGKIGIAEKNGAITDLFFETEEAPNDAAVRETPLLQTAYGQLREYLDGRRRVFDLPLNYRDAGTLFQVRDWETLYQIPYGETRSYGEIAAALGNPKAARAVGMANHKNPIAIIIPCHRVVGADGTMVGYGAGLERKEYLLHLEGVPLVGEKLKKKIVKNR